MGHYDEFREADLEHVSAHAKQMADRFVARQNRSKPPDSLVFNIEHSDKAVNPDAVDDHFRDVVKTFSPTIYKAMVNHDLFYKLQEAIYEVAEMTGWEAE